MSKPRLVRLPTKQANGDPTEEDMERAYNSRAVWTTEGFAEFCEQEWGPLQIEEWDGSDNQAGGYVCGGGTTYFIPVGHPYKLVKVTPEKHKCPHCGGTL